MKKTQIDYFKEVVKMAEGHPEAKIHILAKCGELLEDSAWTSHKICSVYVGYCWQSQMGKTEINLDEIVDRIKVEEDREITRDEAIKLVTIAIIVETEPA